MANFVSIYNILIMRNKTWLAFANRSKCHHDEAFRRLGFISWTMNHTCFEIGDIIYFFVSDKRYIQFKGVVVDKNLDRENSDFWVEHAPKDKTYKVKFLAEYEGDQLGEKQLKDHGFKGYLRHPLCNNTVLIDYIKSIF